MANELTDCDRTGDAFRHTSPPAASRSSRTTEPLTRTPVLARRAGRVEAPDDPYMRASTGRCSDPRGSGCRQGIGNACLRSPVFEPSTPARVPGSRNRQRRKRLDLKHAAFDPDELTIRFRHSYCLHPPGSLRRDRRQDDLDAISSHALGLSRHSMGAALPRDTEEYRDRYVRAPVGRRLETSEVSNRHLRDPRQRSVLPEGGTGSVRYRPARCGVQRSMR